MGADLLARLVIAAVTFPVAFMVFDEIFAMTQGGPGDSSTTFGLFLYQRPFNDFRFGYASAAAYTVALLVFILTIAIFRRSRLGTSNG